MNQRIQIVAGLGNPGREYERTRHNVGFMFVDLLASLDGVDRQGIIKKNAEEIVKGDKCSAAWREKGGMAHKPFSSSEWSGTLIKPLTFMNRSGEPLSEWMKFYKMESPSLIVAHDEIDLPLGKLRIKFGGGNGGHNGIRSVDACLGSDQYARFRLGVGRPEQGADASQYDVSSWVLGKFTPAEHEAVVAMLVNAVEAFFHFVKEGMTKTQNKFHR